MATIGLSDLMQVGKGLFQLVRFNTVHIQVHPLVECLVEQTADTVDAGFVELTRIGE